MEQIKIKCTICNEKEYNKVLAVTKSKLYLPLEIWSLIFNFNTIYKCDLCSDFICVEHITRAEGNCAYFNVHRSMFLNCNIICNYCFIKKL